MHYFKNLLFLSYFVLFFTCKIFADPTFTYSGPTSAIIPYGHNATNLTYHFTYSGMPDQYCVHPHLIVAVDGTVVSDDLCDTPNQSYLPSSYSISLTEGSHTIHFSLLSLEYYSLSCVVPELWAEYEFTVLCKFKVRVENVFSGGKICVNYVTQDSPFDRTSNIGDNFQIGAIDQSNNGYNYMWNTNGTNNSNWYVQRNNSNPIPYSTDRNTSYSVQSNDKNADLVAGLRKVCNSNFSIDKGNTIVVNGTTYTSPFSTFNTVEGNDITYSAPDIIENNIRFIAYWDKDKNSQYTGNCAYTMNSHNNFTANYRGRPTSGPVNLCCNTYTAPPNNQQNSEQYVQLTWNQYPNSNVSYQIWRKVLTKSTNTWSSLVLIATLSNSVTSYTDYDYTLRDRGLGPLGLSYNVKTVYVPSGLTSDDMGFAVADVGNSSMQKTISNKEQENSVITEYSISNYPNPFNPTTRIEYQLPQAGFAVVKVYNAIGKEVATLVNEMKEAGKHQIEFDGSGLPSGIYFCQFRVNDFVQSKKMLLVK